MRKILILISLFSFMLMDLKASYVVLSGNDGKVIEESDMHDVQSVASISKVMSAIIAIEHGDLDQKIVVDDIIDEAFGSMIYLRKKQVVTLRDLLYGLMLRSGNDAALVIAKHVAGSVEAFVELMNDKAKQLQMKHTTFKNPSGLDEIDGGNTSCTYDMAIMMRYALNNKQFQEISKSKHYTSTYHHYWENKNKLLFRYEYCNGGKTGFTKIAGRTLITSALKDGLESIVVTFKESDDFNMHQHLHEKVFENYQNQVVLKKGIYQFGKYQVKINEDLAITLSKNESFKVYSKINNQKWIIEIRSDKHHWLYEYQIEVKDE